MQLNSYMLARPRPDVLSPLPNYLPYHYQKRAVVDITEDEPALRPQTAPDFVSNRSGTYAPLNNKKESNYFSRDYGRGPPNSAPTERANDLSEKSFFQLSTDGDEFYLNQEDTAESPGIVFEGLIEEEMILDLDTAWLLDTKPAICASGLSMEQGQILRLNSPFFPAQHLEEVEEGENNSQILRITHDDEDQVEVKKSRSKSARKSSRRSRSPHERSYTPSSPLKPDRPYTAPHVNEPDTIAESLQNSQQTSEKISLKGLTKNMFGGRSVQSPYIEHLKVPSKVHGLTTQFEIHQAVFDNKRPNSRRRSTNVNEKDRAVALAPHTSKADRVQVKEKQNPSLDIYRKKTVLLPRLYDGSNNYSNNNIEDMFIGVGDKRRVQSAYPLTRSKAKAKAEDLPIAFSAAQVNNWVSSPNQRQSNNSPMLTTQALPPSSGRRSDATHTMEGEEEQNSLLALNMMTSNHMDPLYRIVRDEVEKTKQNSIKPERFSPADIKALSYFQSLPPAVWVTCRIVYFLVVAYYEVVVSKADFAEYVKLQGLEKLWTLIGKQVKENNLSLQNMSKEFSWMQLQELMRLPLLFVKALEYIEHGVRQHNTQWDDFQTVLLGGTSISPPPTRVRSILVNNNSNNNSIINNNMSNSSYIGNNSMNKACPLSLVVDNNSSKQLFYELFPEHGFQSLRELVKAARGVLLGSSVLYKQGKNEQFAAQTHVPGSPLAVSASLTNWVKRIITSLYLIGIQRMRASNTNISLPVMAEASLERSTVDEDAANKPTKHRLPPGLGFVALMQHFQYQPAFDRLALFVESLLSLVKPCDSLDLFLVRHEDPVAIVDQTTLQSLLEQHLRLTSASPLHKVVVRLDDIQLEPNEQMHILLELRSYLHPAFTHFLRHYNLCCKQPTNNHDIARAKLLLMELNFNTPQQYIFQTVVDAVEYRVENGREIVGQIEQYIKSYLNFSVALLNDQHQRSVMDIQETNADTTLRGHRYVVCVSDTDRSWNAFQMVCRLAKESDSIIILHVPCTSHLINRNTDFYHYHDHSTTDYRNPSLTRLSNGMHKALQASAAQRREQIIAHYRGLGYNVYCADSLKNSTVYQHNACKYFSEHMSYAKQSTTTLGFSEDMDPLDRCPYYQYNMQTKSLARDILACAYSLSPDFLVLGVDQDDLFDVMSSNIFDNRWTFASVPELLHGEGMRAKGDDASIASTFANSANHSNNPLNTRPTATAGGAKSNVDEEEFVDEYDFAPYEEDSFIVEDNEAELSFAPSTQVRYLKQSQYQEQRVYHFQHYEAFSSRRARTVGMILHEMRYLNTWIHDHVERSPAASRCKFFLQTDGGRKDSNANFSMILANIPVAEK